MSIDTSGNVGIATGNLTFSGTGQRITGDFSNATIANRLAFQSSTVNGNTNVYFIPNGTATTAGITYFNSSNISNSSYGSVTITSSSMTINSTYLGTGTYLPITFNTGGSEQVRIGATTGTDLGTVGIGYSTLTGVGVNGLAVAGNVGIGTASPTQKLDVNGLGRMRFVSGSGAGFNLDTTGNASRFFVGTDPSAEAWRIYDSVGGANRIYLDTSGNVGIGTSSPGYKLDVGDGTGLQVIRANGGSSGTATGSAVYFGQGGSNNLAIGNYSAIIGGAYDSTGYIYNTGAFGIKIAGGTGYNMYIDTSGNVGIGTASPSARLQIKGAAGGATSFKLENSDASRIYGITNGLSTSTDGLFTIFDYTASAPRFNIDSSGNVIAGGFVALATTATNGFLYVPTCAGTPTGTPTTVTGMAPIVVNTTNNKLYFYSGGAWRDAGP
jgi:hypothetical protein